jgi:hypothetical protein
VEDHSARGNSVGTRHAQNTNPGPVVAQQHLDLSPINPIPFQPRPCSTLWTRRVGSLWDQRGSCFIQEPVCSARIRRTSAMTSG